MVLNLSIKEILNILEGAQCSLDSSFVIKNIASFEKAGSHDLAVITERGDASVFDAVSIEKIKQSNAGVFLSSAACVENKNYILVKDAVLALQQLVNFLEKKENTQCSENFRQNTHISPTAQIADNAVVEPFTVVCAGAKIQSGTFVGSHVFIGRNCHIGNNVKLHPGVKILDNCVVDDNTIIHSGTVVGSDGFGYKVNKTGMQKIPHVGVVRIGKNVEVGANCSIDRAYMDETIIGDGVKIDNNVHIAHNVIIGSSCAILAQTGIAGSAIIGAGCQIGGQVAIKDHVKIGNFVKIVSKSAVLSDVKDNEVICGIPAISFSHWKRVSVVLYKLPEMWKLISEVKSLLDAHKAKKGWIKKMFGW